MAKFKFCVSTHYINSHVVEIVEIPDEELEGLAKSERNEIIDEYYEKWKNKQLQQYWEEIEE